MVSYFGIQIITGNMVRLLKKVVLENLGSALLNTKIALQWHSRQFLSNASSNLGKCKTEQYKKLHDKQVLTKTEKLKIKWNWYQTLLPFPSLVWKYWLLRLKDFYSFLPLRNCLKSVNWFVIYYKYIYYKLPIKTLRHN